MPPAAKPGAMLDPGGSIDQTWAKRLRTRPPARSDAGLAAIYDGLGGCDELLRHIALLHAVRPHPYRLRSRRRGRR